MNKARRKQLDEILESIEFARDELETIKNDEEEYRDNMPENLQGSEKYELADTSCSSMQEAIDQLETATSNIKSAKE